jgi:hypothetical protein
MKSDVKATLDLAIKVTVFRKIQIPSSIIEKCVAKIGYQPKANFKVNLDKK